MNLTMTSHDLLTNTPTNRSDDLRHYEEQERYPKSTKILAILFAGNFTFYPLQMHRADAQWRE